MLAVDREMEFTRISMLDEACMWERSPGELGRRTEVWRLKNTCARAREGKQKTRANGFIDGKRGVSIRERLDKV